MLRTRLHIYLKSEPFGSLTTAIDLGILQLLSREPQQHAPPERHQHQRSLPSGCRVNPYRTTSTCPIPAASIRGVICENQLEPDPPSQQAAAI